jgi:hypothetical protein
MSARDHYVDVKYFGYKLHKNLHNLACINDINSYKTVNIKIKIRTQNVELIWSVNLIQSYV